MKTQLFVFLVLVLCVGCALAQHQTPDISEDIDVSRPVAKRGAFGYSGYGFGGPGPNFGAPYGTNGFPYAYGRGFGGHGFGGYAPYGYGGFHY